MYHLILAAAIVIIMALIWMAARKSVALMEKRGMALPGANAMPALMTLMFGLAVNASTYAQSTLDIDIDLTNFWVGFNQFFSALFPPLAFIASISAALGFIFLIVGALKNAFGGATRS